MLRRILRFRLFALFVLTAVICAAAAFYAPRRGWVVTAQISVKEQPGNLRYEPGTPPVAVPFDRKEFRRRFALWVTSEHVVHAALFDPRLMSNEFLLSRENPVEWVRDNLVVSHDPKSGKFEIRLEHRLRSSDDLEAIVDAVANAVVANSRYRNDIGHRASLIYLNEYIDHLTNELEAATGSDSILTPTARKRLNERNAERIEQLEKAMSDTYNRMAKFKASQSKRVVVRRVGPTIVEWGW